MVGKGPALPPYSALIRSSAGGCIIWNLYSSNQNPAGAGGQGAEASRPPYTLGVQQRRCFLLSPRDIGYLFSPCPIWPPTPAPLVLSISSVQSQSLYLRPWTQAGGELLVKQSLQRFQGREGPGDFAGGRGQGEGQGLVRTQWGITHTGSSWRCCVVVTPTLAKAGILPRRTSLGKDPGLPVLVHLLRTPTPSVLTRTKLEPWCVNLIHLCLATLNYEACRKFESRSTKLLRTNLVIHGSQTLAFVRITPSSSVKNANVWAPTWLGLESAF